jgi:hypothetical protein
VHFFFGTLRHLGRRVLFIGHGLSLVAAPPSEGPQHQSRRLRPRNRSCRCTSYIHESVNVFFQARHCFGSKLSTRATVCHSSGGASFERRVRARPVERSAVFGRTVGRSSILT